MTFLLPPLVPQDLLLLAQGAEAVLEAQDASFQENPARGNEQEAQGAKFVLARRNYLLSLVAEQKEPKNERHARGIDAHAKVI